uniref:Putative monolaris n=1 Tax=Rhipicephalus pulchellus TaxID=72859 RepID=L7MBZ5_RHIPC
MRFLIVFTSYPALMTLLLIGLVAGNDLKDNCPNTTCKTPEKPFFHDYDDDDLDILYIYNETSGRCHDTLIQRGKNHTFKTFFSCVSTCQTGQGSPYCVGPPVNAVNGSNDTNSLASVRNITKGHPLYELLTEAFEAYFYNMTSMQCENYTCYGAPDRTNITNFFELNQTCQEECSGFDITTIQGRKNTN